jgi:hypothetical protein
MCGFLLCYLKTCLLEQATSGLSHIITNIHLLKSHDAAKLSNMRRTIEPSGPDVPGHAQGSHPRHVIAAIEPNP